MSTTKLISYYIHGQLLSFFSIMMTIGELRRAIRDLPDDAKVVVATDPEGRRYAHVSGYGLGHAQDIGNMDRIYQPIKFTGEEKAERKNLSINCICVGP